MTMKITDKSLVILVALLWGFNFVVIRWGIEDVDPYSMTALRFFFVTFPVIFFVRRPDIPLAQIALYGILFGGGVWGFVNFAVFLGTPAGFASLFLQASAFLSVLAATLFFKEQLATPKKIGMFIALIGFFVLIIFRNETIPLLGAMIVFLAAVCWTACNMIIKITKPGDMLSFVVWSSLFVPLPVMLIPFLQQFFSTGEVNILNLFVLTSMKGWISILFQAFVTTLFGYNIWTSAISKFGLVNVTPYSLIVPVSGLLFGWLLYDEVLALVEICGVILILAGLLLLSLPGFVKTKDQAN